MASLAERVSAELLPYVTKPAQYIGGELNQLVKPGDWEQAQVRVAIAFPDTYAIGMSHLGCQILYWQCNHTPAVTAERVYCPWLDAEKVMRARKIPLFTWDTRRPVAEADIFAISLQYEMGFSNVLTLLDLAGIPLRSSARDDSHPLVIGGGPQADNPEPVAPFFDLVVLGDGEAAMAAILGHYRKLKEAGVARRDMIVHLARKFEWIYAPSLYDFAYHPDGTIARMAPLRDDIPTKIARCQTGDFDQTPFPVRPLVPFVEVVHDRIAIEIMRGCPQHCRFCHAGYTKRPLRKRSVKRILDIAEQAYRATGFSEIGLLSLSTADYPDLAELARAIHEKFKDRRVSISVPSLRVDRMLQAIPWMVRGVRKSGVTIAVEAARDDMRAAIRKKVTDGDLFEGVRQVFEAGWRSLKLYFMAGFPGERAEDIDGIIDLSRQVSEICREVRGFPARITVSVGWLVPKPHTPLQWAAQPRAEYFREVLDRLRSATWRRKSPLTIKAHNIERSVLEAVFARGDRRLADAIEFAWRGGARFDGWDECFQAQRWHEAFQATGIDFAWYAHRRRDRDEILPWDHLVSPAGRQHLHAQYDDLFAQLGNPNNS
ncbi:MAG: TIGR03960 family B12-binding radical SAM protein [Phycisphaerae bacterium]|nr:TIGR03960 family B12-binding radical SAM protein [Phycisphaerae bacterium]